MTTDYRTSALLPHLTAASAEVTVASPHRTPLYRGAVRCGGDIFVTLFLAINFNKSPHLK